MERDGATVERLGKGDGAACSGGKNLLPERAGSVIGRDCDFSGAGGRKREGEREGGRKKRGRIRESIFHDRMGQ